MSMEVEAVPHRSGGRIMTILVPALAVLLLGACSSKNPDSLIGMNVDENLAMMDANASADANASTAAVSDMNAVSAEASSNRSDQTRDAQTDKSASSGERQRATEVNAVEPDADTPSDEDQTTLNEDEPSNDF
jgi:hypothetical protein